MKHFFYFITLFLYMQNTSAGFLAGTLVTTPNGHIPIEQLEISDLVLCYDFKNSFAIRPITYIKKKVTQNYLCITCENESFFVSPDHHFYLPQQKTWIPAYKLKQHDILLKNFTEHTQIHELSLIIKTQDTYDITIADYHNFCISPLNITTHNFLPAIALGISFLFGGGISFGNISLAATIAGVGIAIALKENNTNSPIATVTIINGGSCGGMGGPEKDPEKQRNTNSVHKSEFFNSIKNDYKHYRNGIYRRKKGTKGIENAEYLQWDHMHNDVEAFGKNKWHLGSINAKTLKLYRSANNARRLLI